MPWKLMYIHTLPNNRHHPVSQLLKQRQQTLRCQKKVPLRPAVRGVYIHIKFIEMPLWHVNRISCFGICHILLLASLVHVYAAVDIACVECVNKLCSLRCWNAEHEMHDMIPMCSKIGRRHCGRLAIHLRCGHTKLQSIRSVLTKCKIV